MEEAGLGAATELYERAPCGLLTTIANGTVQHINQTFCSWLGMSADAIVGQKKFQDLLTVGGRIFHQTHWLPLLQVQGSVAEVQLELVHRDGHSLPALVNAVRRTNDGIVYHDIAVFIASDRKSYERELLKARKRAEELLDSERRAQDALADVLREKEREAQERAVLAEQLIGIVSHDLRTPLSAILLGAHVLGASDLVATQTRTLNRISAAGNRATRLIEDLLDFTQARLGGGLRISPQAFDIHAVVSDCVEELKLAWSGRIIDHAVTGEGTAIGDADRLAQVVTNLASNALTYGTPGQAVVITSAITSHDMTILVHNVGAPIPPDLLPHLFEPLRRGDHQVRLGLRSVGLGLYIVQQIVNAHGGHITVRSTEAEGTTFTVNMPLPLEAAVI
jgi:sigma-B regulation protein RsbU (phosphoserine phosphatase)